MRLVTQALSTLIELVQGPCVANQAAILRSNLLGMLVPLFELAGCMNLNGTVAMAGGTTSLSWIGCEVLQSCAAIHAFINIQRDASGEKELFKATADDLDVFISGFPKEAMLRIAGAFELADDLPGDQRSKGDDEELLAE